MVIRILPRVSIARPLQYNELYILSFTICDCRNPVGECGWPEPAKGTQEAIFL
jgi:hypothetical protein